MVTASELVDYIDVGDRSDLLERMRSRTLPSLVGSMTSCPSAES